jgi:hypothetical protein
MIRRIVDWFLYKLHLKRRISEESDWELANLLPLFYAVVVLVSLFDSMVERKWYQKLWRWFLYRLFLFNVRRFRREVVGY